MLEVIKIFANWGFPAALCIFLLAVLPKLTKQISKLDDNISNHLTHALEENTEATKKDSESGERVEKAINNLSDKIIEFMERKWAYTLLRILNIAK